MLSHGLVAASTARISGLALLLAVGASPASAQPAANAEDVLARQQSQLRDSLGLDCARGAASEIVVCGRRGPSPYRLPLALDPVPGARQTGDPLGQQEIMAMNPVRCPPARTRPPESRLDLLAIAATAVALAAKAADPDFQPVEPTPPKNCG